MPKQYCPDCGSATDYITQAPKFCGNCGKPYSFAVAAAAILSYTKPVRSRRAMLEEEQELHQEDDSDEARVSNGLPKKLAIQIVGEAVDPRQQLSDIVMDSPNMGSFGRKTKKVNHRRALSSIIEKNKNIVRGETITIGE